MANPNPRDPNRVPALGITDSSSGVSVPASGLETGTKEAQVVAIVDANGDQITSFGGGTQYTDGGTPPAHPVGPTLEFDNAGTWATVSDSTPLPVTATFPTEQDVDLIKVGGSAIALGQALAAASLPVVLTAAQVATLTPLSTVAATQSGSWTVTANAGTNLNTSALATEATLSTLNGKVTAVNTGAVTISAALPAGTNAIGKLAANSGVDIGDVDVTSIAAGTNNIGQVSVAPQTANGLSTFNATSSDGATALTNSAQAIKATAGQLYGWYIYNPNTIAAYVQLYNTAAASVTVGTTNPLFMLTIPAGAAANVEYTNGITFSNAGWSAAATSTAGGNGAPTTALDAVFFYK